MRYMPEIHTGEMKVQLNNSRLNKAEKLYAQELQEWLTNPKNENLSNEIIDAKIEDAFNAFLQELIKDEDECAMFISKGGIIHELDFLPLIFNHFKSRKIYEAIKCNCEIAFSHKLFTESEEAEQKRKEMLSAMELYF